MREQLMFPDESYVILHPDRATIDVVEVAEQNSWRHAQTFQPAEKRLYEEIYEVPGDNTVVRVIDDHFVQVVFVVSRGQSREKAAALVLSSVESLDEATLWRWLGSDKPRERAYAIRALAAISPNEADSRWVEAFKRAACDKTPEARRGLIGALGRAAWPELWPIVDELDRSETDGELREEVRVLRESYGRHIP